jgi:hypothetical protein
MPDQSGDPVIGADYEAMTFAHMPLSFFERLLRAVFVAHEVAAEECQANFKDPERENVLGHYRRAKLEGYMRDVAEMGGIQAQVVKSKKSSWNHTELRSGPVVLTASTVQAPCDLVEESEFRLTLARGAQDVLWPEPGDVPMPGAHLYVLLLHSKSRWVEADEQRRFGNLPGSAYLAYPASDLSGYIHDIDLFARFPRVVDSLLPQEWDTEAKVRFFRYARKSATA